ncbi:MAG: tetratricopeptide repeat protein [Deltaproteobacteria bacterium]|nr:tetratricopeptide repeat protein [Deltaproteobacteria bacterium]
MATEDRQASAKDDDQDDADDELREEPSGTVGPTTPDAPAVDPTVPRNRAERRAAAKAARRGQTWKQTGTAEPEPGEGAEGGDSGEAKSPTGTATKRPRVPPKTMSKGTGDAEGVPRWVRRLGEYLAANRVGLGAGLLVAGLAIGGGLYWNARVSGAAAQAADAYAAGLTAYTAPVSASEPPDNAFQRGQLGTWYRSEDERLRAASHRFRRAEQVYSSAQTAPLARLSEAGALYQLGRYEDARALYRGLLGADLHGLEPRVLEGLAFTQEALGELDQARAQYQSLAEVQGGAYRDLSQYYQARLLSRRGDDAGAKGILHGLIERLGRITGTEASAVAASQLRDQATGLLRDIDPSDPLAAAAPSSEGPGSDLGALLQGAGGPGQLSREQLQRILQQMQKRR